MAGICFSPLGWIRENSDALKNLVASNKVRSVSATDDILDTDGTLLVDATAAARTVTLPPVADVPAGKTYVIKKVGTGTNAVTVEGAGAETIDGAANVSSLDAVNDFIKVQSNGTAWFIVAKSIA